MATEKKETTAKKVATTTSAAAKKPTTKTTTAKTTVSKPATKTTTASKPTVKSSTKTVAPVEKEVVAQVVEIKKSVKPATKVEYVGPTLKITLVRSPIGALLKQKRTLKALGLRKIRSEVIKKDDACTRGMIFVVRHLVSVEECK